MSNSQAAVDSKGWNKAQAVMAVAERFGWSMLLTPYRTMVTLDLARGDERFQLNWRDDGKLMATRRYVTSTRDTKSFSLAKAVRMIETR